MNDLQLCYWQFSHKETLQQTFLKLSAILHQKRPFCVFEPALGSLGATYDNHLRLNGKRTAHPISVNWTFLLGATAEALGANIDWKSAVSLGAYKNSGKQHATSHNATGDF